MRACPSLNKLRAMIAAALAMPTTGAAVWLNPEGLGQALIFPYYTVQAIASGENYNTYLSVVNHAAAVKVMKVRFREGRNGREAFSFDLYLSPNDVWTAALIPADPSASAPARVVTADVSCLNPKLPSTGQAFGNAAYTGAFDDGAGAGLDRTREGFVEMIEMNDLGAGVGLGTAAVHSQTTARPSCTGLVGTDLAASMTSTAGYTAPTGGLSGSLTLINVNNGQDFTLNAIALAELTTRPMYRSLADSASVDFNAPEVDPVSHVVADGYYYRSQWSRPVDAVSAVLMRAWWSGEVVLDTGTRSHSDLVSAFPTRQYYAANATACQPATINLFDRESVQYLPPDLPTQSNASLCSAVSVVSPVNSAAASLPTAALGSMTAGASIAMGAQFQNGWLALEPVGPGTTLTSLATSTRMNLATGESTTGSHAYRGLPVVGLWVRTFENGTLSCNGIPCQGNYGGAFPLVSRRSVTPSP